MKLILLLIYHQNATQKKEEMEKKNSKLKSQCCNADVIKGGRPDFAGDNYVCTMYYVCTKCNNPCDLKIKIRKTWKINPSTKVKNDERGKQKIKQTEKEIRENS